MKKREFIKLGAGFLAATYASNILTACKSQKTPSKPASTAGVVPKPVIPAPVFELMPLPFAISALEPLIDSKTMEIHHGKHHAAYVKNLNAALQNTPVTSASLEGILASVTADQAAVRNNGGGHYNHMLYWKTMQPGGAPKPESLLVGKAINDAFGDYASFSEKLVKSATTVFGSGWAWLAVSKDKKLFISTTPNQDNPLMLNLVKETGTPILGIDVWEHAYYLKHQNKRADYLTNFMQLINWEVVDGLYRAI
jgi:superoxide dismutase, Fe-Mn family